MNSKSKFSVSSLSTIISSSKINSFRKKLNLILQSNFYEEVFDIFHKLYLNPYLELCLDDISFFSKIVQSHGPIHDINNLFYLDIFLLEFFGVYFLTNLSQIWYPFNCRLKCLRYSSRVSGLSVILIIDYESVVYRYFNKKIQARFPSF